MKRILLPSLALLLAACGSLPRTGGYYEDDGPHDRPQRDVASIPDAVPTDEPLSGSGNKPYKVFGVSYTPLADARGYRERGIASWYGKKFHGRRTSSGEPYDMYTMTAAHKTLPLPSYVRVRNLQNGRVVVVRVNDRGPFLQNRLIDLSYAAAARLGIIGAGTGVVEIEIVEPERPLTTVARASTVQIVSAAEAAEPKPGAVTPPRLAVQVGAFQQWENAASQRARFERAGFAAYIQPVADAPADPSAPRLYRVRIGPLDSVEHGDRVVAEAARHGVPDALIVVE